MSNGNSEKALGMAHPPPPAMPDLTPEDSAGLVNVLKELETLAGEHNGVLASLPPNVKTRVVALQELQTKHDELEAKFFEEKAALETKYLKIYEPFYQKRSEIVNGLVEVEGIEENVPKADAPKADAQAEEKKPEEEVKGVPEFWLSAMKTNEVLAMHISERDEGALKFLKDIKRYNLDNPKGFKLEFHFDTNPYFRNTLLTKTYHMIEESEPVLEKAIGTEIEWHTGKNLTQKLLKKKPKKGEKNGKPITKVEKCESLFNFFNPPQVPEDGDELDAEKVEELQELLEQDYDIGSTIRDKIIPHAVSWFTGDALEGEGIYEDDDNDGEYDEDDDEDEDEDDDDDEEEPKGTS